MILKKFSPRYKRYGLLSLILILLLCASLVLRFSLRDICQVSAFAQVNDSRESSQPRSITESTVNVSHQWSISVDIAFQGDILNSQNLIILSDGQSNHVVALKFDSGKEEWTSKICDPSTLAYDSSRSRVYGFAGGGSNREIVAFNLDDGNQLWIDFSQNNKRVGLEPMVSRNSELFVYRFPNSAIFRVNPDTGEFSEPIFYDPQSPGIEYLSVEADLNNIGGGFYWHKAVAPLSFEIRSAENHDIKWYVRYPNMSDYAQVNLIDDMLILIGPNQIIALEKETGAELWAYEENIASNIAIQNDILFLLDTSANLMMLNIETGEIIDYIQFDPPSDENQSEGSIQDSWVSVSDNHVAIYFRDIQILQVIRLELG